MVIAATRKVLTDALVGLGDVAIETSGQGNGGGPEGVQRHELLMAEAVVAPGSQLVGWTVEQAHLHEDGVAAVAKLNMTREPMSQIGLAAGDVLLVLGTRDAMRRLGSNRDLLPLARSTEEVPVVHHAKRALTIFAVTILAIASGAVPIALAALSGALAMVVTGCLTVRQAARAFDRRVYLLVGTAFAMATAMQATGGAEFIAHGVVDAVEGMGPAALLSALFLLTAVFTNFLSNTATAALFAPIVVSAAAEIGVPPDIYGLIFALNCSFATPIAYQTNLIVMGPGHYRFKDFMIAGTPLILILWVAYSIFAPLYYGF